MRYPVLIAVTSFLFGAMAARVEAAPFQNLDFEQADRSAANLDRITVSAGLPGWTILYGSAAQSSIWYDFTPLDVTSVTLDDMAPLSGNFSVQLYGVYTGLPRDAYSASISQTGDIPANAKSIRFTILNEGIPPSAVSVSINGENISVFPLSKNGNIWLMTGDISPFAGAPGTLTFAAVGPVAQIPFNENILELDNIRFSTVVVPEPATLPLALAAVSIFLRRPARK